MSMKVAFPKSARVGNIYGATSLSSNGNSVAVQDHAGLAQRAAFLLTSLDHTNLIRRGVFFKRDILCDFIAAPPSSAVDSANAQIASMSLTDFASYEIFNKVTSSSSCMGCHSVINPPGMSFESFDPLGRKRSVESILNSSGQVIAQHSLPGAQSFNIEQNLASSFNDATEIAAAVGASSKARACMARNFMTNLIRRPLTNADDCAVADAFASLDSGVTILDFFVKSVANEDIFWRKPQ